MLFIELTIARSVAVCINNSTDQCTFGNFREHIFPLLLTLETATTAEKCLLFSPEIDVLLPTQTVTIDPSVLSTASKCFFFFFFEVKFIKAKFKIWVYIYISYA